MRVTRELPAACALLAALAAAGCGQKGPLYLPDKTAAVVTSSAAAPAGAAQPAVPASAPAAPKPKDQDESSPPK
jgi:predicted small lipoprotein YifL